MGSFSYGCAGFCCTNQTAQQSLTPGCSQGPRKEPSAVLVCEPALPVLDSWNRAWDPRRGAADRTGRTGDSGWEEATGGFLEDMKPRLSLGGGLEQSNTWRRKGN